MVKIKKETVNKLVSLIQKEGKVREENIRKPYVESQAKFKSLVSQSEKKSFTKPEEYKKYKIELEKARYDADYQNKRKHLTDVRVAGSKINTKAEVALERISSKLGKLASQKVVSKKVLAPNKMEVHIQNKEPAKYVPIYFKQEIDAAKRSMFFE